jgi:SAM-dependent methyltransferase
MNELSLATIVRHLELAGQPSPRPVIRFLELEGRQPLEAYDERFRRIMGMVSPFRTVGPGTRILEVGIGNGWFPVMCAVKGFDCVGLDNSALLIEFARARAKAHGVQPELRLGSIEHAPLEPSSFDVVIADAVFEHVENWRAGLANVAACLKPGGVLVFGSTNRFAFLSGEYPLPFYGWLPNPIRYRLRQLLEGRDVMTATIDFHSFTYPGLRRGLHEAGFGRVYDSVDLHDPERLNHPTWWKIALLRTMRRSAVIRHTLLTFWPTTELVAIK